MTRPLYVILSIACALSAAAADDLPAARAIRTQIESRIDGRLDESYWSEAPRYSEFHRLGRKGGFSADMERTEFQVACDRESLLVGITCFDPNVGDLIAKVTERDGPSWSDDAVEIFVRLNDRFYYQFAVNSLGTVYDARATVVNGAPPGDVSRARLWDGVIDAAVTQEATHWTVEVRIPFATLDIGPDTMDVWRFNIGRSAARRKDYSSWAPVQRGFNDLPRHGYLEGIEIDPDRFPLDAASLEFPALRLGSNQMTFEFPTTRPGTFQVSTSLREWDRGPRPPLQQQGPPLKTVDGNLALALKLPVTHAGTLNELILQIAEAGTGRPVLQRMHLFRAPEPMHATLQWAVYYQSESSARLDVDITVAPQSAQGTLDASIYAGQTRLRQHQVAIEEPGNIRVMLPIDGLAPDLYRLVVTAQMKDLPPTTRTMRFNLVPGPFDK
jgi:hypothetical protein